MKSPYILYVEDDEIEVMKFLHTIKDYFDSERITVANDGAEGLKVLVENRMHLPKLIILYINMPKMNGLELLSVIKKDSDFKNIPVIMLTTSENKKDVTTSFKNQVAGYFVKPFDPEKYKDIIRVINQYWQQSQTIS